METSIDTFREVRKDKAFMWLKTNVADYFRKVWKNKARIVVGLLISVVLFIFSCKYLYAGINKQFIIFSFLSVSVGMLIIFPMPCNRYLSIPAWILYLLLVPGKMFVRIEYPIHDMNRIQEGAELVNILIILLVFAVLLLIFQKVNWALGIGSILILIVSVINFYLNAFRGNSLSFNDLLASGTALTVLDNYQLFMTDELWYSILYFCVFIALGFWCKAPYRGKLYHGIVSLVAVAYICGFGLFWNKSDYLEDHGLQGHYWNMAENELMNGFLLSFGISMEENTSEKPAEYSIKKLQEIEAAVESTMVEGQEDGVKPNIIFIMNEAWSDLRVLGNLEVSEPFMPFVDSLSENTTKGNVHVGILGGLTANSEFEVLTGDSLSFLAVSAIPYQLQINHPISSMATILEEQGYQTMAMHPSGEGAWNRDTVYENMGFDSFIDVQDFETEYEYVRTFISDRCNFNEIIYRYEQKEEGKPLFLFDVTIQNHADFYGGLEMPIEIERVGDVAAEDAGYIYDVQTYLNLMKVSDGAFEELVQYFSQVEEPTIICMFGDHQPSLGDNFYEAIYGKTELTEEDNMRKYITPYVIWSNYDSDFEEYGDMSANYLGAVLLDCAGVEKSVYYEYLVQLQKEYPVLSHIGCLDAAGNRYTIDELQDVESIRNYQMLQYNQLIEEDWEQGLFSVN